MVDERRFSRLLFRALAVPVAALAILAGLLAWQVTHLLSLTRWVDHTDQVISDARAVERLMIDMETGERGFLLSGEAQFLEPWTVARQNLEPALDALGDLVSDNALQEHRLSSIRSQLGAWTTAAEAAIDSRDHDVVGLQHRKALMDALRGRVAVFIQTEESLRAGRSRAAQLNATLTLGGALAGTLLFGVLIGFASRRQVLRVAELYESAVTARELVLQSIGDGIYGIDAAGRIMFLNPAGASLLGCTPAEALGRDAHALFHHSKPDRRPYPPENCPIYKAFHDGAVHRVDDEVFWRKDGSSFPVSYVSTPIHRLAALEGAVVSFRDITRDKQREAERQHLLEQAQEGVRARDHVLSIASHELRTPLTSLKLQMDLLGRYTEREAEGGSRAGELRRRADACRRQVMRLERLVGELLDAARLRAGRIEPGREIVDLTRVVRDSVAEMAPQIDAAGCTVALDLDEPTTGIWDREELGRILSNLLSNAIEFGKGKPVDISVRNEGTRAVLTVRDRGTGVRPEDRDRIFHPLEQADLEHHAHGLGLGLYISRELAHAMGGDLEVGSTLGPGATFHVLLPK